MDKVIFSIGEINIICTDAGKSLAFYRDILGFKEVSEENGCWHLACGSARFLLLPVASSRGNSNEYCSVPAYSIDLIVEDLEAAERHLKSNSVDILSNPKPNETRFFIRDPDNLVLEIIAA